MKLKLVFWVSFLLHQLWISEAARDDAKERCIDVDSGFAISCGSDSTTLTINETELLAQYNLGNVTLTFVDSNWNPITDDAKCTDNSPVDGAFNFNLNDYFGQCAFAVKEEENGIYRANYTVCVEPQNFGVISRYEVVYFHFDCVYDTKIAETLGPLFPFKAAQLFDKEVNSDPIKVTLELNRYLNSSFIEPDSSRLSACDGEDVYLEMAVNAADQSCCTDLVLSGIECVVSPTSNDTAVGHVHIIEDGCAIPDPLPGGDRVIYENFESWRFRFSFTSFHWTVPYEIENQELHVICVAELCNPTFATCYSEPNCSTPQTPSHQPGPGHPADESISGRRKRSNQQLDSKIIKLKKKLDFGPIKIAKRSHTSTKRTCDKAALGCSFACTILSSGRETCICPREYVLGFDQRSCAMYKKDKAHGNTMKSDVLRRLNDAISITIMIISVAALVSHCYRKRKQSLMEKY